jgi:cytoskeletal protein RodZ
MAGASDNGGWSDNGSPDDLPDLPEEWGVIVVPDDLSELSDEVEAIRAELRLSARPTRWRRLLNRPGMRRVRKLGLAALRAPVLIISMAVLVTVASLVASAWPGPPRQPAVQRTSSTDDQPDALPALELIGDEGQTVQLRAKLPAVVLVTDGCDCDKLITDTAAAAHSRAQVAIVVIEAALKSPATKAATSTAITPATQTTPQAQTSGQPVVVLHAPPSDNVRDQLKLGAPDGTAAALLVDRNGRIVKTIPRTASVEVIQPYLARI